MSKQQLNLLTASHHICESSDSPLSKNPSLRSILDAPIFIVGAPRSGTTWVQRLLLSHPAVCGGQESHFFAAFAPVLRAFHAAARVSRPVGLPCYWTADDFRAAIRELWRNTMTPLVSATPPPWILLEKSPIHSFYMQEILELLPASRFIHVIRDSRSVAASLLAASKEEWGQPWAPATARDAAIGWWRYVIAARTIGESLADHIYTEVFYEDLMTHTRSELARLFEFMGLNPTSKQLAAFIREQEFRNQKNIGGTRLRIVAKSGPCMTSSPEPVGFFRRGSTDSWRQELSITQKLIVWRFTRRLMKECGYSWNGRAVV